MDRRAVLRIGGGAGIARLLALLGVAVPMAGPARGMPDPFSATRIDDVIEALATRGARVSTRIRIQVPDVVEDGRGVIVGLTSELDRTEEMSLVVIDNPFPMVVRFRIGEGAEPAVVTRVRMDRSTDVLGFVKADGAYHFTRKPVRVILSGCRGLVDEE